MMYEDLSRETAHKNPAGELQEAARVTKQRADQLAAVFDAIPDALIIYDGQGNTVRFNAAAKAIFRLYQEADCSNAGLRKRIKKARLYTADNQPFLWEKSPLYEAVTYGRAVNDFLLIQKRQQAVHRYYAVSCLALAAGSGESAGGVALIKDITELKKAELEAKAYLDDAMELVEKLRRDNENKNAFFNMLSHELRNPLASIKMSLMLLDQEAPGLEKEKRAKEIAKRQLAHLTAIVDELLDMARLSQQKIILRKERMDLVELMQKIVEDYRLQFADKGVELITEINTSPLDADVDSLRMRQIMENLLGNAYKFTKKGDKAILTLTRDERTREAVIVVSDSGIGIKPQSLNTIFQPFVQFEESPDREGGGLGLGLAMVKGLVELHGGSVGVYSEGIGKGAQFTVRLPLPENIEIPERNCIMENNESLKPLHILMIEDNVDFAQVMCDLISLSGYRTSAAHNGQDGVAKARELHPDVIICDIGLPGMTGYEVAQAIRNDMALMDIFLIALSGYTSEKDLERCRNAGFDWHLAKPVDMADLENIFHRIIDNQAAG